MRRFFLASTLSILMVLPALAAPVNPDRARALVSGWLQVSPRPLEKAVSNQIAGVESFHRGEGQTLFHLVKLEPEGFVVVSPDDQLEPIVLFAPTGSLDLDSRNCLVDILTGDMTSRLDWLRNQTDLAGPTVARTAVDRAKGKWEYLLSGGQVFSTEQSSLASIDDVRVDSFVQSRWNQSTAGGSNCYNYFTPNNYVCGCVATAMSQLIRFHSHPTAAIGVHSYDIYVDGVLQSRNTRGGNGSGGAYDWSNMPLTPASGATDAQRQEIGSLCFDAGLAVNMSYALSGSGADTLAGSDAFKSLFHYTNSIKGSRSGDELVGNGFNAMANPNLDAGFPVLLGITGSSGGHAIVCDGYGYNASTLYHHLNLGWAGSSDAWYNLPNIGTGYSFNKVYKCIYNVFPSGTGEILSGRVVDEIGNPINGVSVTADGLTATTNARGIYAIVHIPTGTYTVTATKAGYAFTSRTGQVIGTSTDYGTCGNLWGVNLNGSNTNTNPTISTIANQTLIKNTPSAPIPFTIGDGETPADSLSLVATSNNLTLIPVSNIVFGGSGANRTVTITPALNQFGTGYVRIRVNDADGGTNSVLFSVTLNNTNPTITTITNQTIHMNTPTVAIPFTIGDAETSADSMILVKTSSNLALIPLSNIVFGGSGTSRTVTITPATNQFGTGYVRVRVNDADGGTNSVLFSVTVAANTNPTITAIANQATHMNMPTVAIPFTIGDAETSAVSLILVKTSSNLALIPLSNIVFGGSGTSRTVTITPATNQFGTGYVRVRVNDADGGTNSVLFSVTVAANTNPTITAIANQSTHINTPTVAIPFTIGDAETSADSLVLVKTSSNLTLIPLSNVVFGGSGASRTVTITPAANQFGTGYVRVRVNDADGGTNSVLFSVTVSNTDPTITTITNQTLVKNTSSVPIPFTIGDAETPSDSLAMVATSNNLTLIPVSNIVFGGSGTSRTVTITPAINQSGTGYVRVRVNDTNGGTNSTLFAVTVTPSS